MNPAAIVAAMAALEEWQMRDDDLLRKVEICFVAKMYVEGSPLAAWQVSLEVDPEGDRFQFVCVHGQTMADALAQAAGVVRLDPMLESAREEG